MAKLPRSKRPDLAPSAEGRELGTDRAVTRRDFVNAMFMSTGATLLGGLAPGLSNPLVGGGARFWPAFAAAAIHVPPQPYFAEVKRALDVLVKLGAPIAAADAQQIAALTRQNNRAAVAAAEKILDRYTLAGLSIDADGSAHVTSANAQRTLVEQGWRMFLVRVANPAGRREIIHLSTGWETPARMARSSSGARFAQRADLMDTLNKGPLIEKMWLLSELYDTTAVVRDGTEIPTVSLSGFPIEYRVLQLYSRDHGPRRANLGLTIVTGDGFGSSAQRAFDFECRPSRDVTLGVLDEDGRGCVASLTIRDKHEHLYPPQAMRLAPDLAFQPHIYRADGEAVRLPDGEYTIDSKRGPEYLRGRQTVTIGEGRTHIQVQLQRWIDPAKWGWYSGDTHIHAAGCAHYDTPTEGVSPETMIRHVRGEGLSVGDVLTWGPSWYYQKQFFTGLAQSPPAVLEHPELQAANNATWQPRPTPTDAESLLRYDVEVSGFPSSMSGHLVLLRLKDQDYPGTKVIEDWPSWNLPILQWAKAQGAVGGYAHCGSGMVVDSTELPNYEIPPFDNNGTNEAIVDVTHGLAEFLSGCNGPPVAELNAWYHLLNCGFRLAMVGETDYPCFVPPTDARPGIGRSYVRLDHRPVDDAGYDAWVRHLQQGRLYYGDGRTHFLEFAVNGQASGEEDVILGASGTVEVTAKVAARLEPTPTPETLSEAKAEPWHIEHARMGSSRNVAVELVVNGISVDRVTMAADGTPRRIRFTPVLTKSSWVALRVMASGHTYPVFVQVGNKPIRASLDSAKWCRVCVDKLWEVKAPHMRGSERPAAADAYEHARRTYDAIIRECEVA